MADIQIIVLFNGTSNDDTDPAVTNVVKMRDGLKKDDTQFVIYRDGIGNDKEWRWYLPRLFAEITGFGGGWVMRHAYQDLHKTLTKAIQEGKIKQGDTLHFSVGGFSRGAALARHFANHLVRRITHEMNNRFKLAVNIQLACEYLFDTVPSFGIPINFWILDKLFAIRNQEIDLGWNFSIPKNVKAYHTVAADDRLRAFTPHLINFEENVTEEVWWDGDHSSIGGGHTPPTKDAHMGDENTLRYMVRHAMENGLRFDENFVQKYNIANTQNNPLGVVKTPTYSELPPTQRGPRTITVMEKDAPSERIPLIAESIIRRMQNDPNYRPENIKALQSFAVHKETGENEIYAPNQVRELWKSLEAKPPLRFSPRTKVNVAAEAIPPVTLAAEAQEAGTLKKSAIMVNNR